MSDETTEPTTDTPPEPTPPAPKPRSKKAKQPEPDELGKRKSVETIAQEVLDGRWGYGLRRMTQLESAGYNYQEVADAVASLRFERGQL